MDNMNDIQEILTLKNMIIYLVIINIIGFLAMWIDKRRAQRHAWRIPEKTLMIIAALGGGIGTIAGMYIFRHKTQKIAFVVGMPLILIVEIIAFVYFVIVM